MWIATVVVNVPIVQDVKEAGIYLGILRVQYIDEGDISESTFQLMQFSFVCL